jgi:hypothetical protein
LAEDDGEGDDNDDEKHDSPGEIAAAFEFVIVSGMEQVAGEVEYGRGIWLWLVAGEVAGGAWVLRYKLTE